MTKTFASFEASTGDTWALSDNISSSDSNHHKFHHQNITITFTMELNAKILINHVCRIYLITVL